MSLISMKHFFFAFLFHNLHKSNISVPNFLDFYYKNLDLYKEKLTHVLSFVTLLWYDLKFIKLRGGQYHVGKAI